MSKKKETLPKKLREYKDEPIPFGGKVLIYEYLKSKKNKKD